MKNIVKLIVLVFLTVSGIFHSCKKEEIPTLTTSTITNITATSASSGGNITSDGGAGVTARGVCWSVNANPTTSDSKTSDGQGMGQFVSNISGLAAGLKYHIRAYATNSIGIAYGADLSFSTLGKIPECITQPATNITSSGSTLNGTVNANDLSTIVTFEYGTTASYGQTITATQSPVTGNSITNVTGEITGLAEGANYHFRVKTVNSLGTTYGKDMSFTTLGQAPTATTLSACCLTTIGAKLNGIVNANYASTTVTFDYGTTTTYGSSVAVTPNPVTGNNSTSVSVDISGLNSGTTYHFRIKAVSSLGTVYGDDMTFTTLGIPTLNTNAIIGITFNSAYSGGNIISDGGTAIISRGVCWSTNANPTTSLSTKTTDGTGTGSFLSNITGLMSGTLYHVRAYATNSTGTAYGNQQSFTTSNSPMIFNPNLIYGLVSDVEGNCYKTIQIGDQIWMAENLKTSKYNDGTPILNITDNNKWASLCMHTDTGYVTTGAYCWYNNDSATYEHIYGKLYNCGTVATDKLCPTGWHVPDYYEWRIICNKIDDFEPYGSYGQELIETGTIHWFYSELNGTNETGFTALPGGRRDYTGTFLGINQRGCFWTSNGRKYPAMGYFQDIYYSGSQGTPSAHLRYQVEGQSIRCLKD